MFKTSVLALIILSLLSTLSACTKKVEQDNSHEQAPTLLESGSNNGLESLDANSKSSHNKKLRNLFVSLRKQIVDGSFNDIINGIVQLEEQVVNKKVLSDSSINSNGYLSQEYGNLVSLHGYALSLAVSKYKDSPRVKSLLKNYKELVLYRCSDGRDNCRFSKVFKGSYGVFILSHIINEDIKAISNSSEKNNLLKINSTINNLYIAKHLGESHSNRVNRLFVKLSSVFFKSVDINSKISEDYKKYIHDFQNILVRMSKEKNNTEFCKVIKDLNQDFLVNSNIIKDSFINLLKVSFYECNSKESIIDQISKLQSEENINVSKEIVKKDAWLNVKNNFLYRKSLLKATRQKILNNFSLNKEIPPYISYLMDQIYYGKISENQYTALAQKFNQEDLTQFIKLSLQYVQYNFIYMTHYTFAMFNSSANLSYKKENAITNYFIQNLYDNLVAKTSKPWKRFKQNSNRYLNGLNSIYALLDSDKKKELKPVYDEFIKKINRQELDSAINHTVTFPILLATKYFIKKSRSGIIELKFNWLNGVDNTITVSVANPFANYFSQDSSFSDIKILDFGYLKYEPTIYEKNMALSLAVKSGFFDVAHLNLEGDKKGLNYNLIALFKAYIEDNTQISNISVRNMQKLKEIKSNHWNRIKNLCQKPLSASYNLNLKDLSYNVHVSGNNLSGFRKDDQNYIKDIYDIQDKIELEFSEIQDIKRTYQVIKSALNSSDSQTEQLLKSLREQILPHVKGMGDIYSFSKSLLAEIDKEQPCLIVLNKIERFKKNLLQRKIVEQVAKVHSAMKFINDNRNSVKSMKSVDMQVFIDEKIKESKDTYLKPVLENITQSNLLSLVEGQLGFSGEKLLVKSLNLALSAHNFKGQFGYPISGIRVKTNDLSSNFLSYIGGFDGSYFRINSFDEELKLREQIYNLKVPVFQIRKYFKDSQSVLDEVKEMSSDSLVALNPEVKIILPTYKKIKDTLNSRKDFNEINFSISKKEFVKKSLESIFGNNQNGDQVFYWSSSSYSSSDWVFKNNLKSYLREKMVFLESKESSDLTCLLEYPFGEYGDGCVKDLVSSQSVVDSFIASADFEYIDQEELYPLIVGSQKDKLDELVSQTLLDSDYIPFYMADNILSEFKYYKYQEEISRWTWFDGMLANYFTTTKVANSSQRLVNISNLPGVSRYEEFYTQVSNARAKNLIFFSNKATHKVMRNYYRHTIISHLDKLDNFIEAIVEKEQTLTKADLPTIYLRSKDIRGLEYKAEDQWLEIPIAKREQGPRKGSLILLGSAGYELAQLRSYQRKLFSNYNCDLLPQEGDKNFVPSSASISQSDSRCIDKVDRWMKKQACKVEKKRASRYNNYKSICD